MNEEKKHKNLTEALHSIPFKTCEDEEGDKAQRLES